MRHPRAIVAVFLAVSPANVMAANDAPNVSDEQMTCAGAAAKDYTTANAELSRRATANGTMSIEDTIAQRRLAEDFCKRWAACLVNDITDTSLRENALRATFAGVSPTKRQRLSSQRKRRNVGLSQNSVEFGGALLWGRPKGRRGIR